MSIYERVEELRKAKGLSQRDLETKCGFSNGLISKWKKHDPTIARLEKVAVVLETSVEYLRTGDSTNYYITEDTAKIAQEIFENKELRLLFDVAKDAGPEKLSLTRQMLLAMKQKEQGDYDDTGC